MLVILCFKESNMVKRFFLIVCALLSISISYGQKVNVMRIETTNDLIIYYPQYSYIDLACEQMPEKTDTNVLFCCEAAFTGELLKEFKHSNIAGHHVSGGKFYRGYKCKPNTGCFVFYQDQWKFLLHTYADELKLAAENGGMGFGQNMIIYDGETQPSFRKLQSKFEYRALCEYHGKLCVIDSKGVVSYASFINSLEKIGVTHALYLDMGRGWNHSWYRDNKGTVVEIHPKTHSYTTNWIVFMK